MKFTILGASGFVGSHLVTHLQQLGHACYTPGRGDPGIFLEDLGHVVYCIGLTADFRQRPYDTVRAHVCLLADILEKAGFESLLYLSSTRVYMGAESGSEEQVLKAGDLYNLSKLSGEALCFASGRPSVRVARLSNVCGHDRNSDNFLQSVVRAAIAEGKVTLRSGMGSAKDYIGINDVVKVLADIALFGNQRLYNVASGQNIENRQIMEELVSLTGCHVDILPNVETLVFPAIEIGSIKTEFNFEPEPFSSLLGRMVNNMKQEEDGQT